MKNFYSKKTDSVRENDKIYIIINSIQMAETLDAFSHEREFRKNLNYWWWKYWI